MLSVAAGSVAAFVVQPALAQDEPAKGDRPNIVFIMADDLGYSDLGSFGGEVDTPNLDALAEEGLRFTNFYNMSRCCPTRASLLTGLYPHQAGIGGMTYAGERDSYRGRLHPYVPTVAEVLKDSGYATGMVGKWHVSNTLEREDHMKDLNRQRFPEVFSPIEQYPTRRGFDFYYGNIWGVVDFFNPFSLVNGEEPVKELPDDYYITNAINENAVKFIEDRGDDDAPYFLYIAHCAPHWPLHALPEDIEKYRDQYNDGHESIRQARYDRMVEMGVIDPETTKLSPMVHPKAWDKLSDEEKEFQSGLMQAHAAMVDRMDQGLGDVFQAIKDNGDWDNTLIVFLSDNGASPERYINPGFDRPNVARDGEPIHYEYDDLDRLAGPEHTFYYLGFDWANVANTPYRKAKASQYMGGERTPMIAHWPAGMTAEAGSFVRAPAHVIDLMATALDLAGAKMPDDFGDRETTPVQGKSLRPLLEGAESRDVEALYGAHEGGKSIITADGWKLVQDRNEQKWHLFNLNHDGSELDNVADDHPDRVKKMSEMWEAWAKKIGV